MRYISANSRLITATILVVCATLGSPSRADDMSRYLGKYPWEKVDGGLSSTPSRPNLFLPLVKTGGECSPVTRPVRP